MVLSWFQTEPSNVEIYPLPSSGRPNIVPARIKWWNKWVEYSGGTIFYQSFLSSTIVEYSTMGRNNLLVVEQYSGKIPYMRVECYLLQIQKSKLTNTGSEILPEMAK